MVLTSCERFGAAHRTGVHLESFVAGYYTFRDEGIDVTLCSPLGGPAPIAPEHGNEPTWPDLLQRFHGDPSAREEMSDTLMLSQVCPADFSGVFYADGAGAASDLVDDRDSQNLIAQVLERGCPCAFVGYGAAALLRMRNANGESVVAGHRLLVPDSDPSGALARAGTMLSLGDAFSRLGARIVRDGSATRFASHGNLITGLDTASSIDVARALVQAVTKA